MAKNEEAWWFPSTRDLKTLLEKQKAKADFQHQRGLIPRYVFPGRGKGVAKIVEYKRAWNTACREAGLPDKLTHDFRRTAVRNLVRAGVPEVVAMRMTGHKTRSGFDRCNIFRGNDLREAARKLDARTGVGVSTVDISIDGVAESASTSEAAVSIPVNIDAA